MSTLFTDFIKDNKYFFESSSRDIHGSEIKNTSALLQDRKWEITWFIKNHGLEGKDLIGAFSTDSELSDAQKKNLAEALLLSSALDKPHEVAKDIIDNFLLHSPIGESVLESSPNLKAQLLESQADCTRGSTSTHAIAANLETLENYKEEQYLINDLKGFVALDDVSEELNLGVENKAELNLEASNELDNKSTNNAIKFNVGSDLKAHLESKIDASKTLNDDQKQVIKERLSSLDGKSFESSEMAKSYLGNIVDEFKQESEAKLDAAVRKSNFISPSDFMEQTLVNSLALANHKSPETVDIVNRATSLNQGREFLPKPDESSDIHPQLIIDSKGDVISVSSQDGMIMGAINRNESLRKKDVDYATNIHELLKEKELTLTRIVPDKGFIADKYDKYKKSREKRTSLDGFAKLTQQNEQEASGVRSLLKKAPLVGKYVKDAEPKEPNPPSTDIVEKGSSELVDKDGDALLVMSDKESVFEKVMNTDASFRVNYEQKGFMNPDAHKFAALKAKESGLKNPYIILPSRKDVSDRQKLEFFKSNYRALLKAGYESDEVGYHKGATLFLNSGLKEAIEQAKKDISLEFAAQQTALDYEDGGLAAPSVMDEFDNFDEHQKAAEEALKKLQEEKAANEQQLSEAVAQTVTPNDVPEESDSNELTTEKTNESSLADKLTNAQNQQETSEKPQGNRPDKRNRTAPKGP